MTEERDHPEEELEDEPRDDEPWAKTSSGDADSITDEDS
jgi:hypothetical protein